MVSGIGAATPKDLIASTIRHTTLRPVVAGRGSMSCMRCPLEGDQQGHRTAIRVRSYYPVSSQIQAHPIILHLKQDNSYFARNAR